MCNWTDTILFMDGRRLEESLELAHHLLCQVNRLLYSEEVQETFGAMIDQGLPMDLIQGRLMIFLLYFFLADKQGNIDISSHKNASLNLLYKLVLRLNQQRS